MILVACRGRGRGRSRPRWHPVQVRLRPVVGKIEVVVDAVADSLGEPLVLDSELDVDVYRLRRSENGPDLVARVFGSNVERTVVDAAAHVLLVLGATRFPAERCASKMPVVSIGQGRHLLVTEYAEPLPAARPGFVLAWCAALLGRLANRTGEDLPAGGGWHRLGPTPSSEISEALRIGGPLGAATAEVVDVLSDADDGAGLPEALVHADLTPPNAVPQGNDPPLIIDWVGVGRGPRAWPLAFLLYAAGPRGAGRALERYTRSISLSEEERYRLPGIMIARPLTLDLWSVAHERMTAQRAAARLRTHRSRIEAVMAAIDKLG
jgi:Ser/Thr protein kinase RdoA (MazF antagonist)